jgi:hypothetical protein
MARTYESTKRSCRAQGLLYVMRHIEADACIDEHVEHQSASRRSSAEDRDVATSTAVADRLEWVERCPLNFGASWEAPSIREPSMNAFDHPSHEPWNKGKLVGQKCPLRLRDIYAIRIRPQLRSRTRDLALFNLAIDSKLRGCDLVKLRVRDVCHGACMARRSIVLQQKTHRPVQFEITEQTRIAVSDWIACASLQSDSFLFPSRLHDSPHLSTRQYARIVDGWISISVSTWLPTERTRCDGRKPH